MKEFLTIVIFVMSIFLVGFGVGTGINRNKDSTTFVNTSQKEVKGSFTVWNDHVAYEANAYPRKYTRIDSNMVGSAMEQYDFWSDSTLIGTTFPNRVKFTNKKLIKESN